MPANLVAHSPIYKVELSRSTYQFGYSAFFMMDFRQLRLVPFCLRPLTDLATDNQSCDSYQINIAVVCIGVSISDGLVALQDIDSHN